MKNEPQRHGDTLASVTKYKPISWQENKIGTLIIKAASKIHRQYGPGLLEKIYEICLCHELKKSGLYIKKQVVVPITYDDMNLDEGLRIDIMVNDSVIVELKAQENFHPVWEAQLLSYMKLTDKRLGYLINFHVPIIKKGIKRMVL